MKAYLKSHPWITFSLDSRKINHKTWMLLGEAQSKCEHIAGVPLLPDIAQYLHRLYLAKGVMATTAIEGNTLTEDEVLERLSGKLKLPPSKEYLGQEIDNIIEACNLIGEDLLRKNSLELRVADIKKYNQLVLKDLPVDEDSTPGEIRKRSVGVGRYRGAPAADCEYLLEQLCDWLNNKFDFPGIGGIATGILKAVVAHIYIVWIHPFDDGNGRTARLIEFRMLLQAGAPSTTVHLLSNHYNETRSEYYRQLDRAHQSGGDIFPFIQYALQGLADGLKQQIEVIQSQQLKVHWVNYIHETFRDKNSRTDIRRRRLAIDLSNQPVPVPIAKVRHISTRIAEAYANKSTKTVKRDLNALEEMGLVEQTAEGVRARIEIILAFLPYSTTMPS